MASPPDDWRNGKHVVYRLHAHIVLTPKYRRKVMTDRVSADLRSSFEEVCGRFGVSLDAFEVDQDHAHLLVTYPPKVALSRLVMSLKTISSMRVRAYGAIGFTATPFGPDPTGIVAVTVLMGVPDAADTGATPISETTRAGPMSTGRMRANRRGEATRNTALAMRWSIEQSGAPSASFGPAWVLGPW